MNIRSLFDRGRPVFSLEVFPPKKTDGIETVYKTLDSLSEIKPDYISVTYGAGGSAAGGLTCRISGDIKTRLGIEPLAHLTCLYSTREQVASQLEELRAAGICNILALRGDRIPGVEQHSDFPHASDLARFISGFGGFNVVGACYPEGHPESAGIGEDIENLKYKIGAGVTHLNSQLFFSNDDFYTFLEKLRRAGITVPVEAGIMPVTNTKQIKRMVSMCGASLPKKFTRMMARYEHDPRALLDAGIAYATDQAVDLLSGGADGIHLYTMNRPEVALRIYSSIESMLGDRQG